MSPSPSADLGPSRVEAIALLAAETDIGSDDGGTRPTSFRTLRSIIGRLWSGFDEELRQLPVQFQCDTTWSPDLMTWYLDIMHKGQDGQQTPKEIWEDRLGHTASFAIELVDLREMTSDPVLREAILEAADAALEYGLTTAASEVSRMFRSGRDVRTERRYVLDEFQAMGTYPVDC